MPKTCVRCGQRFVPGEAERVEFNEINFLSGDKNIYKIFKESLCLCCSNEFRGWLFKRKFSTCDGDEF